MFPNALGVLILCLCMSVCIFQFHSLILPIREKKKSGSLPLSPYMLPSCLLLLGEFGSANVAAAQLDVEDALHVGKDLLVGGSGAALKVGDNGLSGVALCGEVLLGHLGLHLLTGLRDDVADGLANGVWLDNVVGSVDLGETLTFAGTALLRKEC